jgi:hypothetical protein
MSGNRLTQVCPDSRYYVDAGNDRALLSAAAQLLLDAHGMLLAVRFLSEQYAVHIKREKALLLDELKCQHEFFVAIQNEILDAFGDSALQSLLCLCRRQCVDLSAVAAITHLIPSASPGLRYASPILRTPRFSLE